MNKKNVITYIISFIFSTTIVLTHNIQENKMFKETFFTKFHFDFKFFLCCILLSIITFFILKFSLNSLSKINIKTSSKLWNSKIIFIISFISIFLTGILFLLTYFPGTCMVDTLQLIYDPIAYSSQYPLYYSLIQSSLFHYFLSKFSSMNIAFFMISLLQLIYMTSVISFIIRWAHITFKSNKFTLLTIIYFNCFTIFTNLNSAHLRDTIFTSFILLLIPFIYKLIITKGESLNSKLNNVFFTIILCLITLIRNNGIFTIIVLIITLCIVYKSKVKKLIKIMLIVLLVANSTKVLPKKYKREPLFQESIAVPLQQVFYLTKYDKIDEEGLEYMRNLIPIFMLKDSYDPFCVDMIKWHGYFYRGYLNENKLEFMKIWLNNMGANFEDYIKVYLTNSYSLWSIHEFSKWESRFLEINLHEYNVGFYFKTLNNKRIFPANVQSKLQSFYEKTTIYVNNATCFWIYVLLALVLLYKNKKEYLLIFVPFFAIWLNLMLAAPLSSAFRYMCSFGYALPFLLMIIFIKQNDSSRFN